MSARLGAVQLRPGAGRPVPRPHRGQPARLLARGRPRDRRGGAQAHRGGAHRGVGDPQHLPRRPRRPRRRAARAGDAAPARTSSASSTGSTKRPRITAFNDFGGRTPSDKPPIKTPRELAKERGEPWPPGRARSRPRRRHAPVGSVPAAAPTARPATPVPTAASAPRPGRRAGRPTGGRRLRAAAPPGSRRPRAARSPVADPATAHARVDPATSRRHPGSAAPHDYRQRPRRAWRPADHAAPGRPWRAARRSPAGRQSSRCPGVPGGSPTADGTPTAASEDAARRRQPGTTPGGEDDREDTPLTAAEQRARPASCRRSTPAPRRRSASCSSPSARTRTARACGTRPARVARAYAEIFAGLLHRPRRRPGQDVRREPRRAGPGQGHPDVLHAASTTCVPFHGVAHVGYIPGSGGRVTGLSKLARRRRPLRPPSAGPGAPHRPGRRRARAQARAARGDRRDRRRAPVHVGCAASASRGRAPRRRPCAGSSRRSRQLARGGARR